MNEIFLTVGPFDVEAAHFLENYAGKCSRMHGHRWEVKVTFGPYKEGDLNVSGLADDFKDLKLRVRTFLDKWDHQVLNEVVKPGASAENLALVILKKFPDAKRVELWESRDNQCTVERS